MRAGLALVFLIAAGCGGSQSPTPLTKPDPAAKDIVLSWSTVREVDAPDAGGVRTFRDEETGRKYHLVNDHEFRFEMRTDHRFRYSWRDQVAGASWRTIEGTWAPHDRGWRLSPDAGRAALVPDDFAPEKWPLLRWSRGLVPAGPDGPTLGATFLVPEVDGDSGRLSRNYCLRPDPRARIPIDSVHGR